MRPKRIILKKYITCRIRLMKRINTTPTKHWLYAVTSNKIFLTVALLVIFMWLNPHGTFNPRNPIFYVYIIEAFVIMFSTTFVLKKLHAKK